MAGFFGIKSFVEGDLVSDKVIYDHELIHRLSPYVLYLILEEVYQTAVTDAVTPI
jgi:hypothetical protein